MQKNKMAEPHRPTAEAPGLGFCPTPSLILLCSKKTKQSSKEIFRNSDFFFRIELWRYIYGDSNVSGMHQNYAGKT